MSASLLVSRNASAHDRSVVVTLDGGTCVTHSALRDAVTSRGGRISDDANVHLRVKVESTNDGRVGVAIGGRGARGALEERRFVASSCADAIDALGLVIALAGDETERSGALDLAAAPALALAPSVSHASESDASASPSSPPPPPAPSPAAEAPATHAREASTPSRFALFAGAVGTTLGEGQAGARIGGTLEWRRSLLPWIEVSASANIPRAIEGGGGAANATWVTARLASAPIAIDVGSPRLRVSLFGAFDAGALTVSGSGATRVDTYTRPWLALAAGMRGRWDLGDRFFAGLDAAATVPLVRDDFVFLNGGTAYRVPAIGVESAICVGAHFP